MTSLQITTYRWESYLIAQGARTIAGVDEVGRGALAGPLMAGAVVLPPWESIQQDTGFWSEVRDSKTLTHARRESLTIGILERAIAWGIGTVEADELDSIGVAAANRTAMERAVWAMDVEPGYLLIDATTIDLPQPQQGLIDGDALSLSIAAASIIAKTARDTIMIQADGEWPGYGFASNKGYASARHREALGTIGPCPIHRFCYKPVQMAAEEHGYVR